MPSCRNARSTPPPPVDQRRPGSPLHHRHRLRLLVTQDLVPDPPRHRPLRRRRASPADHGTAGPDHRPKRQKALASGNRAETLPAGPRRPGPPARNPSEDVAGDADRHQLMDAGRLAPVPGPAPPIRPPGTPTKAPRIPPDRPRRRRVETGPAPEGPRNPIDIQHGQNVLNSSNNQGVRPGENRRAGKTAHIRKHRPRLQKR